MDAQEFLVTARDPIEWFDKADELRISGDILWQHYSSEPKTNSDTEEYRKMAALTTSVMIYAMAIEAALKGKLLREDPDRVRFSIETNGAGEVQSVSIKQFSAGSHNLEALAESVGLVAKDGDQERRELLRRLTDCLLWISRYPVPKTVSDDKKIRSVVPIIYQNRSIREEIDEILDELLSGYDEE